MAVVGAAVGALVAGVGAAATTVAGNVVLSAFARLAAGVAISALASALQPKPGQARDPGTITSEEFGETKPHTQVLGRYITSGVRIWHGSHDYGESTPNGYYQRVIALSAAPCEMRRIRVNGVWRRLWAEQHPKFGYPIKGFREDGGRDHAWVRFYDGTQTDTDPDMLAAYGDDPDRPWDTEMVGYGTAYAIITARYNREIHKAFPDVQFELHNAKYYDPRRDSSVGGDGPQRWADMATHEPSRNPRVLQYNVLRGLRDPLTGNFAWGGQGITAADLPLSAWVPAMNHCDEQVIRKDGSTQARYVADLEISFDQTPVDVLRELNKACCGRIADVGGVYYPNTSAVPSPVLYFSDADVVYSESETLEPFQTPEESYNGVQITHPSPANGYRARRLPVYSKEAWLVEDGGRENFAGVTLPAVTNSRRAQRIGAFMAKDARRAFRHVVPLPPDSAPVMPNDVVSWTSQHNGYDAKDWFVDLIEDLPGGYRVFSLREVDPADDEFDTSIEVTEPGEYEGVFTPDPIPPDFTVTGVSVRDSASNARIPGIDLRWSENTQSDGVVYKIRNAITGEFVPGGEFVNNRRQRADAVDLEIAPGIAFEVNSGDGVVVEYPDPDAGHVVITSGLMPDTGYEVRAAHQIAGRKFQWSNWMTVTTPDTRLKLDDFSDEVRALVQEGADAAADAAAKAEEAKDAADANAAAIALLVSEDLNDLQALIDALGGWDANAIAQLTGIAVAGHRDGWLRDPSFYEWNEAGDNLVYWSTVGVTTRGSQDMSGQRGSALRIVVPAGQSDAVSIRAEPPAADVSAEYVAVSFLGNITAADILTARLRPEWRIGGVWVRGDGFGEEETDGSWLDWQLTETAIQLQSRVVVFKKPAGTATAVALHCAIKQSGSILPVNVRIDILDIRAATQSEIDAHLAGSVADAKIDEYNVSIVGPNGAIAQAVNTVTAAYTAADAAITSSVVAVASDVQALAARTTELEVSYGDTNNIVNTSTFENGSVGAWAPALIDTGVPSDDGFVGAEFTRSIMITGDAVENPLRTGNIRDRWYRIKGWARTKSNASGSGWNFRAGLRATRLSNGTAVYRLGSAVDANSNWTQFDIEVEGGSVDTAGFQPLIVGRGGTGQFEIRVVDLQIIDITSIVQSNARITEVESVSATNTQALASITNTVNAKFGSMSSFVNETSAALATVDDLTSLYSLRVVAGDANGLLQIVANDDPGGAPATHLKLDFDDVYATGRISARHLVVADGANLVRGANIASPDDWDFSDRIVHVPVEDVISGTIGSLMFDDPSNEDITDIRSLVFPVEQGERYFVSYTYNPWSTAEGNRYRFRGRLAYLDENGDEISADWIGSTVDDTDSDISRVEDVLTPPSGAFQGQFQIRIYRETKRKVRFALPLVRKQERGSVLITPRSITGAELVTTEELISSTAQIGELTVGTLQIKDHAISEHYAAEMGSDLYLDNNDQWYDLVSVTVSKSPGDTIKINPYHHADRDDGWIYTQGLGTSLKTFPPRVRLRRDSTTMFEEWPGEKRAHYLDANGLSGNFTYKLQVRADTPPNTVDDSTRDERDYRARFVEGYLTVEVLKK